MKASREVTVRLPDLHKDLVERILKAREVLVQVTIWIQQTDHYDGCYRTTPIGWPLAMRPS